MQRVSFKKVRVLKSTRPLELIHSDVCGPMPTVSKGGSRYFATFIDDYTRKTFVLFLKSKDQLGDRLLEFKELVENEKGSRIGRLRSDNGGEYINRHVGEILRRWGILHERTAPYCPQQNGVAERANRTIVEKARCMLKFSKLDDTFWAEAVATSVYIKNLCPMALIGNLSPEEAWSGNRPDAWHLKVFGCRAFVMTERPKRRKWDPISRECIFVGYQGTKRNYKFYDTNTGRIVVSPNAVFDESPKEEPMLEKTSNGTKSVIAPRQAEERDDERDETPEASRQSTLTEEEENEAAQEPCTPEAAPNQLRRSSRHSTPPARLTYVHPEEDDLNLAVALMVEGTEEPEDFQEAVRCAESESWKKAIYSEL